MAHQITEMKFNGGGNGSVANNGRLVGQGQPYITRMNIWTHMAAEAVPVAVILNVFPSYFFPPGHALKYAFPANERWFYCQGVWREEPVVWNPVTVHSPGTGHSQTLHYKLSGNNYISSENLGTCMASTMCGKILPREACSFLSPLFA